MYTKTYVVFGSLVRPQCIILYAIMGLGWIHVRKRQNGSANFGQLIFAYLHKLLVNGRSYLHFKSENA